MEFMKNRSTKSEAKAFRTRWKIVNNAEREELRSMPVIEKFNQLVALMSSVEAMGWTKALATEEKEVRNRWNKLRRRYHV
jgi:hypothetical protein